MPWKVADCGIAAAAMVDVATGMHACASNTRFEPFQYVFVLVALSSFSLLSSFKFSLLVCCKPHVLLSRAVASTMTHEVEKYTRGPKSTKTGFDG